MVQISDFADARQGSLWAAEDLYGPCSFEYQQVANAWHAVGVGGPASEKDFAVVSMTQCPSCGLTEEESVTATIQYFGCDSLIPASFNVSFLKSNPPSLVTENVQIPEGVAPGEIIEYTFNAKADFSAPGMHTLSGRVASFGDVNVGNNVSDVMVNYNALPASIQSFDFEGDNDYLDTMALVFGDKIRMFVIDSVGKHSSAGLLIESENRQEYNQVGITEDHFDKNEKFAGRVCFCVDATNLQSLDFKFDLRQTYSTYYADRFGVDRPEASIMRVMIDDEEAGRYIPTTYSDDPWETHMIPLDDYLGTNFNLCLETRTVTGLTADPDSIGDRVFLDNIILEGIELQTSVTEYSESDFNIFPNPSSGVVNVESEDFLLGRSFVSIFDMQGKIIETEVSQGNAIVQLDISGTPPGVYIVSVQSPMGRSIRKLILE